MFPANCENCNLETKELVDRLKPNQTISNWCICKYCEGKLYQHEFRPRDDFRDLCRHCGGKFEKDIHC